MTRYKLIRGLEFFFKINNQVWYKQQSLKIEKNYLCDNVVNDASWFLTDCSYSFEYFLSLLIILVFVHYHQLFQNDVN